MLTLTDLLTRYQEKTNDTTTDNQTLAKERLNQAQLLICSGANYSFLRRKYQITTVAGQQDYDEPINLRKVTTVYITVSGNDYPINEISDPYEWEKLNTSKTVTSDYPQFFYRENGQISFYPTPASSSLIITERYIKRPAWLEQVDYSTGTITVTSGSTAVTGSATVWTGLTINDDTAIVIKGKVYRIASITSNTALVLAKKYQGTSGSAISYKIGDMPILPEEFQDLVWIKAAKEYYGVNKADAQSYKVLDTMEKEIEARLQQSLLNGSTRNVFNRQSYEVRSINDYPQSLVG